MGLSPSAKDNAMMKPRKSLLDSIKSVLQEAQSDKKLTIAALSTLCACLLVLVLIAFAEEIAAACAAYQKLL